MAGVELVETVDPDGLAERERLLAAGWRMPDSWPSSLEPVGWAWRPAGSDGPWTVGSDAPEPDGLRDVRRVFLYH